MRWILAGVSHNAVVVKISAVRPRMDVNKGEVGNGARRQEDKEGKEMSADVSVDADCGFCFEIEMDQRGGQFSNRPEETFNSKMR